MFQKTIVDKYLNHLDKELIENKYKVFQEVYGNPEKQENIRSSKEEEYQTTFICDLFCTVLGYTIKPEPNFNIIREAKNESENKNNARKADGAIVINDGYKAVIELKGTDTTNLDSVASQAFDYKSFHKGCNYVIVSNFEKLRLYVEDQTEFEEFNLFKLTKEQFAFLYLLLALPQIEADIPLKLKHETLSEEKEITNNFYIDYSAFKRKLFEDLCKNNPDKDKLLLFKKTQKLLDRILFILFCEDRNLLPANSIIGLIKYWQQLKLQPLYDFFKIFFERINTGFVNDDNHSQDIFAYNGGLFKPDEILDNVKVGDAVLYEYLQKLANYDFDSQISVDILGHIFEHSLTEIEEIQNQIEAEKNGTKIVNDNDIGKRKKDGVFYTPAYITQYIVENTIGRLCDAKKEELKINDEEFVSGKKYKSKELKELDQQLVDYRTWLLSLKILDPACGSGAFLNAALRKLRNEHKFIDSLWRKIHQDELYFDEIDNTILENNLYGVDINEESIEIAKLSLWLNTAKKNRKLTTLNDKIKCGNSLIDDPNVASEKAFDWQKEFPEVFEKGGFDVVIGNPPYVNANDLKKSYSDIAYNFLKNNYETAKGTVDLYIYFFEKGLKLLAPCGLLSFITPNRYLSASYGTSLREYILEKKAFYQLIDYSDKRVFADASTYPVITFIKNSKDVDSILCGKFDDNQQIISKIYPSNKLNILEDSILGFLLNDKLPITQKIVSQGIPLSKVGEINATSTAKEADDYANFINETEANGYKLINTGTIDPYYTKWGFSALTKQGKTFFTPYFSKNENRISANRHSLYSSSKIIISKIGLTCEAFYDKNGEFASIDTNCIHSFSKDFLPEYILCWLNSKLYNYMFECFFDGLRMSGGYLLYSAPNLRNTYIKQISIDEQKPFIELADKMLSLNTEMQKKCLKFISRVRDNLNVSKISATFESFYSLSFSDFVKELGKQKIKLSLKDQDEWQEYFEKYKAEITELKEQITATDSQINLLVYKLYGLTEEEIATVEKS